MIKDLLANYGLYIYIGLGVLSLLIILILIFKKKEVEEDNTSILDVNIDGVVDTDFKYGYEKEDTVIIKTEDIKKEKKKSKKKK